MKIVNILRECIEGEGGKEQDEHNSSKQYFRRNDSPVLTKFKKEITQK